MLFSNKDILNSICALVLDMKKYSFITFHYEDTGKKAQIFYMQIHINTHLGSNKIRNFVSKTRRVPKIVSSFRFISRKKFINIRKAIDWRRIRKIG